MFYYFLSKTISDGTLSKVNEIIEENFVKTVNVIKKDKLYENPKNIVKKIISLEDNQNFLQSFLVLSNDKIIFSSDISLVDKRFLSIFPEVNFVNNKFNDKNFFYITKKLTENKKIVGIYKVEVATHVIEHLNDVFLKYILIFMLIFFIIIFITINILLLKPINNLEINSKKIALGNLNARIDVKNNAKDELSKFTGQFNEMARSLDKIMSEKNTLLRVLSHDLTNQIGSSSSLLKNTIDSSEHLSKSDIIDYLYYIENDLKNAQKLIDFTKKFIAVEAGKIDLDLKKVEVLGVLRDSILTFKNQADSKNIKIILNSDKREYYSLLDFIIFRYSIVDNLLSNAVKFSTPHNDIFIDVSICNKDIYIKFINFGEYIPKDKIKKLFSLTEKTTSLGTQGEKGTGFGLPIVYKFINIMNAQIEIESNRVDEKTENIFTIILKSEF